MNGKIKDPKRKKLVIAVQQQIQKAIDLILAREGKLPQSTKNYLEVLEGNIEIAPYVYGYMYWPEKKENKR
jgi:hypothetical protein